MNGGKRVIWPQQGRLHACDKKDYRDGRNRCRHASRGGQRCGIGQPLPQELPSRFHVRITAEETGNLPDASIGWVAAMAAGNPRSGTSASRESGWWRARYEFPSTRVAGIWPWTACGLIPRLNFARRCCEPICTQAESTGLAD